MINKIKIYGDILSGNCLKVKYVADYLNIPYEWIHVDVLKGKTRTPAFLKINPFGQIPVVQFNDGQYLAQSNAIIKYLSLNSALIPDSDFLKAKVDEWLFWEQYSHEPAIAVLRFKIFYQKMNIEDIDPKLIQKSHATLAVMENHLVVNNFFVADKLTVADISLLAYTRLANQANLDLNQYPSVCRWIKACEMALGLDAFL